MERNAKAPDAEVWVRNGVGWGRWSTFRRKEESSPYCELGSRLGLAVETHSVSSD